MYNDSAEKEKHAAAGFDSDYTIPVVDRRRGVAHYVRYFQLDPIPTGQVPVVIQHRPR